VQISLLWRQLVRCAAGEHRPAR